MRLTLLILGALALVPISSGCADRAVAPYPISEPPKVSDAAFGPGDSFDVRVYGEADLTGTYQAGADGAIAFPLIGRVLVTGKLPSELEIEIQARLADGYLKNPQVSVLAKEYRSKKVSVLGQVKSPGTFQYVDNMSIIEAVSKAGGFTPSARKNAVRVTRSRQAENTTSSDAGPPTASAAATAEGPRNASPAAASTPAATGTQPKVQTIIVAVEDIGRGYAPNFYLRPGDVIYVPERAF
jgi:protein involved in polysaccharide export with SLBB domain